MMRAWLADDVAALPGWRVRRAIINCRQGYVVRRIEAEPFWRAIARAEQAQAKSKRKRR